MLAAGHVLLAMLCLPLALASIGGLYVISMSAAIFWTLRRQRPLWWIDTLGREHATYCIAHATWLLHACGVYTPLMSAHRRRALKNIPERNTSTRAICVTGDSSFTFWSDIVDDTSPYVQAYNVAFGGATSHQLRTQVVTTIPALHRPDVVIMHVGANDFDIWGDDGLEAAFINVARVHEHCKKHGVSCRFVVFTCKPGFSEKKWAYMDELQSRIARVCPCVHVCANEFEYYVDGMHLRPDQYRKLGNIVLGQLV